MSRARHELRVHGRIACLIVCGERVLVQEVLILIGIASTLPSAASTWTGVGPNSREFDAGRCRAGRSEVRSSG